MSTTLTNLNTIINDRRRDSGNLSTDMTQDGFRAINGTLQIWNMYHDWPWQLEELSFNYQHGIDRYNVLQSVDFKAIVNVRPYRPVDHNDPFYYVSQNSFDSDSIHTRRFAVETKSQGVMLRCRYQGNKAPINTCTDPATNGTWVAGGAVSGLAADTYDSFEQSASITFNFSGTAGTFTNSTMTASDLSRYLARSGVYLNLNLQSVANFQSVQVRIGSDASNYILATMTTDYLGNAPSVGWNRFGFQWNGLTTVVGSPVYAAMTYAQVTLTYSGSVTMTGCNIENLWVTENVPMVVDYYSNDMVIDGSSAKWQVFQNSATVTDKTLWSGQWDFVTEPFINAALETIMYLTGQEGDEADAMKKAQSYIGPLKEILPSKRRYPQVTLQPDLNGPYRGSGSTLYRRNY